MANRIRVVEGGIAPMRAYSGDAGLDIYIRETVTLQPGETRYIPSGVCLELDPGYCASVMPRSSSFKYGVIVTPTLIDETYRDEISTICTNITDREITLDSQVEGGLRLAQVVLQRFDVFENEAPAVESTERGSRKTGSSNG